MIILYYYSALLTEIRHEPIWFDDGHRNDYNIL